MTNEQDQIEAAVRSEPSARETLKLVEREGYRYLWVKRGGWRSEYQALMDDQGIDGLEITVRADAEAVLPGLGSSMQS